MTHVSCTDKRRDKRLLEEHFEAAESSGEEEVCIDYAVCVKVTTEVTTVWSGC